MSEMMQKSISIFKGIGSVVVADGVREILETNVFVDDLKGFISDGYYPNFIRAISNLTGLARVVEFGGGTTTADVDKLRQCAKWAHELWEESIIQQQACGLLAAYLIAEYIGYPKECLNVDVSEDERQRIVSPILGLNVSLTVPEDAAYSDLSHFKEYQDGLRENDLGKVLSFFKAIEKGQSITLLSPVFSKIIRLIYHLWYRGVAGILNKSDTATSELVFQSLEKGQIARVLACDYEAGEIFPLARGFIILAQYYSKFEEQTIPYEHLTEILRKINLRSAWPRALKQIVTIGGLKWNPVFHYCFGILVAKDEKMLPAYLQMVDFSSEEKCYGDSFSMAVIKTAEEEVLHRIAQEVARVYFTFLKNQKNRFVLNRGTGYLNLIFINTRSKVKSIHDYENMLASQITKIGKRINSWFPYEAHFYFQVLFLIVASNWVMGYEFSSDERVISNLRSFLLDERHASLLSGLQPELLINMLTNHKGIESFDVVYDSGQKGKIRKNKP